MMKRLIGLLFASFLIASPAASEPVRRALFADGRLWILKEGALYSFAEASETASLETGLGRIADICVSAGRLTVAMQGSGRSEGWQIRQSVNGAWNTVAKLNFEDAPLNVLACDDVEVIAVFDYSKEHASMMAVIKAGQVKDGRLNGIVRPGEASAEIQGSYLYIGINAGEWGGGLQRINLANWLVESIDQLDTDDGCGGPLYSECDPVTGISQMPGSPQCLALTTGLSHMSRIKGSVLSVCDRNVIRIYDRALSFDTPSKPRGQPRELKDRFTSIVAVKQNLFAAGMRGVYQIDPATRNGQLLPMPTFRRVGPFTVSFKLPDLVLVATDNDASAPSFLVVAMPQ